MFKNIVKLLGIAIISVFFGYLLGITTSDSSFAAKGIKYRVIDLSGANSLKQLEDAFNKMGAKGWELVEWGRQPTAIFRK